LLVTVLLATVGGGVTMLSTAVRAAESPPEIEWYSYAQGLEQARQTGKHLLVNFSADWCIYCKKMKKETYTDPDVIAYINEHFVPVMVDTQKEKQIANQYYVRGLPTIWFLTSEGAKISNLPGFVDAPMFLQVLKYLASSSYEQMDFKSYLDAAVAEG
jgi:thioredoxin-related protein